MKPVESIFVIPTNRLRDVAETVEKYDQHFWTNGHAVKIMVFDDSSTATRRDGEEFLAQAPKTVFPTIQTFPLKNANEVITLLREGTLSGAAVLDMSL
jgi:D-arabinose 1-dehydrogenase-like Zn-dependent alcohol dehydrogenase